MIVDALLFSCQLHQTKFVHFACTKLLKFQHHFSKLWFGKTAEKRYFLQDKTAAKFKWKAPKMLKVLVTVHFYDFFTIIMSQM